MKRVFLLLFGVGCCIPLSAEIISSVSFNPSRMGEYTYLKVADKASLKGGLNAATMNISSGGTVTMNADSSSRIYEVPTVTGASGSAINMPNTAFHGNTSNTYSAYKSESGSAPSGLLPNVNIKGGTQTYNNDSYIQTLDAVNMLKQKVGSLKGGTLEITGNNGSAVSLYETGNTAGFHLAGNDIPEPTSAHTNTNSNLTGCQLAWEKRKTSESPAKEVYLLALQGCNGTGGGSDPATECTPGETKACGDNRANCQGKRTCDSEGKWGSCKRPNGVSVGSNIDTYCSADAKIYNCGAGCAWSDASYSCYKLYNMDCPDNAYAHSWACQNTDCE